jgi:hypothetical protein
LNHKAYFAAAFAAQVVFKRAQLAQLLPPGPEAEDAAFS